MTVRELINKVAEEGLAVRLNWPNAHADSRYAASRQAVDEDFPTAILPGTLLRELDGLAGT